VFAGATLALWLLFFVQALWSPILLDDWFQLRYWRDHEFGWSAIWTYAHHNYFHYNPRIGEVFLAIIHGSDLVHLVVTPVIQLALPPIVFAIAFGRRPRPTLSDLQLLLFIQVMIWLVIPIPGILYFYRPFATNYVWGFTLTLALFVPYRLALAGDTGRSLWLAPIMFVLGWIAGMCNEHTGPTAMVGMAAFVGVAWYRRRLRAWMVTGMVGLYIGYPMLFFAPGQSVRYAGLATRDTPAKLLAERGVTGCFEIVLDFVRESWLGILLFLATVIAYLVKRSGCLATLRGAGKSAAALLAASVAIVMTLFASPTTTDRVFFASGVLLVAAFATAAERLFVDRVVRRLVIGACIALAAYHYVRFVDTSLGLQTESAHRIALLDAARPGSVAIVPSYEHTGRSRWYFGDDFSLHPWLADYVGGELFDLGAVELDQPRRRRVVRHVATLIDEQRRITPLPASEVPTYRQWLADPQSRWRVAARLDRALRFRIDVVGLPFEDPRRRRVVAVDWSPHGWTFVDGRPYDDTRGHFIRVLRSTIPERVEATYITGCGETRRVEPVDEGPAVLLAVDERHCRGPFTAVMCEPYRCWIAGWY
jgi:hypothetical protein